MSEPKAPIRLNYRQPEPALPIRERDPAVVAAVALGLMVCIPIVPGLLAVAAGIAIRRKAETRRQDQNAATLAIVLGSTNLVLYGVVMVRVLVSS